MFVDRSYQARHFSDEVIDISHVVIHGTGVDCTRTLEIFTAGEREVSAHLVIDRCGTVYELVPCLEGTARKAFHAGVSRLPVVKSNEEGVLEGFNGFSLGIELVNLNGNVFPYSEPQYRSLFSCIEALKARYPALRTPEAVVGHEHIAGYRGKVDPGRLFEWDRLFGVCYPGLGTPERRSRLSESSASTLRAAYEAIGFGVHPDSPLSERDSNVCQQFSSTVEALLSDPL
jgi:N-acetylmuramoyl-L-alanine amidase